MTAAQWTVTAIGAAIALAGIICTAWVAVRSSHTNGHQ